MPIFSSLLESRSKKAADLGDTQRVLGTGKEQHPELWAVVPPGLLDLVMLRH